MHLSSQLMAEGITELDPEKLERGAPEIETGAAMVVQAVNDVGRLVPRSAIAGAGAGLEMRAQAMERIARVNGGNGDDILIAGRTSYDDRTSANQQALGGIRNEWVRTDATYQVRIDHLSGATPGGLNGTYYLKAAPQGQTVFDDTGRATGA
jgi:hypothetical protein